MAGIWLFLPVALYCLLLPTTLYIVRKRNRVLPGKNWASIGLRHLASFLGFVLIAFLFALLLLLLFPVTVVRQPGFVALLVDVAFEVGYLYSLKKRAGFRHLVTAFLVSRYVMIASFLAGGAMFWLFQPAR
jgi:hypothetical protein